MEESNFYANMAVEGTNISDKELLSKCLRSIDTKNLQPYEVFTGYYEIPDTNVHTIKYIYLSANFEGKLTTVQVICWGKKTGVVTQLKSVQPKALETHCHDQSLNLAIKGTNIGVHS